MGAKINFIICAASGTVRDASFRILDEVKAADPVKALKPFLKGLRKKWVVHESSATPHYARAENPVSFISDAVDNVAARAGTIERDADGRIRFEVELVEWEPLQGTRVLSSAKVWAATPLDAVRQCLRDEDRGMPLDTDDTNDYYTSVPVADMDRRDQSYRAKAVAAYMDQREQ